MISINSLKKSDKIAIVAPSGKIDKKIVLQAKKQLEEWGLQVVLGEHIFNKHNQFAGRDEDRLGDFQQMLDDDSIKAILCARGGYGAIRIINQLDFTKFSKNPKWIIGFSDITIFHSHIHANLGIETAHAIMAKNLTDSASDKESSRSLKKILFGDELEYNIESHKLNKLGNCSGELAGGNLSILYSLGGTNLEINTKNKILFIEDLNEYLYHLDRIMHSLKLRGQLSELKGLIVGGMTDMKDNKDPFGSTPHEIIKKFTSEYNYPICFDFPAGHIESNMALILGRKADLQVRSEGVSLNFKSCD